MHTCESHRAVRSSRHGFIIQPRSAGRLRSSIGLQVAAVLGAWTVLVGALAPATAQGQTVRIVGRVQWIAAEKMMVIPDNGGLPIDVDITQVGQDQYQTLTEGSPVIVVGVASPDGNRVIATSISPGGG